jgi:hypothetical protein
MKDQSWTQKRRPGLTTMSVTKKARLSVRKLEFKPFLSAKFTESAFLYPSGTKRSQNRIDSTSLLLQIKMPMSWFQEPEDGKDGMMRLRCPSFSRLSSSRRKRQCNKTSHFVVEHFSSLLGRFSQLNIDESSYFREKSYRQE